jgi:3-hydroxyanthranilate 3,4-dioxygenase
MPVVDLMAEACKLAASGKHVSVLWQSPDSLCFVARGREYRSEFHINPSDESMYLIKDAMRLHSRTRTAKNRWMSRPGLHHLHPGRDAAFAALCSRRFRAHLRAQAPPGEIDRFQWYCSKCDDLLHEESFVVADYAEDPASKAYQRFFDREEFRTCRNRGAVMPAPAAL